MKVTYRVNWKKNFCLSNIQNWLQMYSSNLLTCFNSHHFINNLWKIICWWTTTILIDLPNYKSGPILLSKERLHWLGTMQSHYRGLEWLEEQINQQVKLAACISNSSTVIIVVPQGSILGPILFTVYIEHIFQAIRDFLMIRILYADDTTVLVKNADVTEALQITVTAFSMSSNWFAANRIKLNESKTEFMVFWSLYIELLDPSNRLYLWWSFEDLRTFELLGVILDEKLTFENHVSQVCSEPARSVSVLYKLWYYVSIPEIAQHLPSSSEQLYAIWTAASRPTLQPLLVMKNKAIRTIHHILMRTHTVDLYKDYEVFDIMSLHRIQCAVFFLQDLEQEHTTWSLQIFWVSWYLIMHLQGWKCTVAFAGISLFLTISEQLLSFTLKHLFLFHEWKWM